MVNQLRFPTLEGNQFTVEVEFEFRNVLNGLVVKVPVCLHVWVDGSYDDEEIASIRKLELESVEQCLRSRFQKAIEEAQTIPFPVKGEVMTSGIHSTDLESFARFCSLVLRRNFNQIALSNFKSITLELSPAWVRYSTTVTK